MNPKIKTNQKKITMQPLSNRLYTFYTMQILNDIFH